MLNIIANSIGASRKSAIVYDSDAQAFFTAAGISSTTEKNAVNASIVSLKSAGLWATKITHWYPMVGGTAASCSYNAKNPALNQITWGGTTAGMFTSTGFKPEGAQYGDTGIDAVSALTGDFHAGYYSRTDVDGLIADIGADVRFEILTRLGNQAYFDVYNSPTRITPANANSLGYYGVSANGATYKGFKNGSLLGSGTVTAYGGGGNIAISNWTTSTSDRNSTRELALIHFGTNLSDAEWSTINGIVTTFQTSLARNV
jgi:hypothetical protein